MQINAPFNPVSAARVRDLIGVTPELNKKLDRTGDASSVTAAVPGIAAPKKLAEWLKHPIHVERFGAVGDFNGTTGTQNDAALAAAIASGEELVLSAGRQYFCDTALVVRNRPFHLRGAHMSSALVFGPAASGGLDIAQESFTQPVEIDGVQFIAMGRETGRALSIVYPDAEGFQQSWWRRVRLQGVVCRGVNPYTAGWGAGIYTKSPFWMDMEDILVVGRMDEVQTTNANFTYADAGLVFDSGDYSVGGGYFRGIRVYCAKTAVIMRALGTMGGRAPGTAMEGMNFHQVDFVSVNNGFEGVFSAASAGFVCQSGHVNAFYKGVTLVDAPQAFVKDMLFYKHPLATTEFVAVHYDRCDASITRDVQVHNMARANKSTNGGMVGVRYIASNKCQHDISVFTGTIGVDPLSGDNNVGVCRMAGVYEDKTDTMLTSSSTFGAPFNHTRRTPIRYAVANETETPSGVYGGFTGSIVLDVVKGEVYDVSATIKHSSGNAGGDFAATIYQTEGDGSVLFNGGAPQAVLRQHQAANTTAAYDMNATMEASKTGTVMVSCLIGHAGSVGKCEVGQGRMTIKAE